MKLLMVIAKEGFKDKEFRTTYDYFRSIDPPITIDIASTEQGRCLGSDGMEEEASLSFDDVVPEEYFAVVIIGGPGAKSLHDDKLYSILASMAEKNAVISAICYSPAILASAGVLQGKNATVWNKDGNQRKVLEDNGAIFVDQEVVRDELFVTGNGPAASLEFAKEVISAVEDNDCWQQKED